MFCCFASVKLALVLDSVLFWDVPEFTFRVVFSCYVELIPIEEFVLLVELVDGVSWEEFVAVAFD